MWVLIISLSVSLHGVALTTVPGFTSKANCDAAAKESAAVGPGLIAVRAVCVQVR